MSRRWRPSLGFVLGGALTGTLALSLLGLVVFRYLGPEIGFRNAAGLLALLIALATAGLGWLLVRLLLRPIRSLEAFAQAQEAGPGPVAPPAHFGTSELHATARSVIAMAEVLRDREATIRSYTDHVTHELRAPVATIRAAVELLEDGGALGPEDLRILAKIDGARAQIETQLAALRQAARAREVRYLGRTTLAQLTPELTERHPHLAISVAGADAPLPIGTDGLAIILDQLLRNAAEQGAGRVELSAGRDGRTAWLTVSDNGPGISPGNAAHIFEPFYTTRRNTGGTGMGLTIVRNILAAHRGAVALVPCQAGATFRVSFAPGGP